MQLGFGGAPLRGAHGRSRIDTRADVNDANRFVYRSDPVVRPAGAAGRPAEIVV